MCVEKKYQEKSFVIFMDLLAHTQKCVDFDRHDDGSLMDHDGSQIPDPPTLGLVIDSELATAPRRPIPTCAAYNAVILPPRGTQRRARLVCERVGDDAAIAHLAGYARASRQQP